MSFHLSMALANCPNLPFQLTLFPLKMSALQSLLDKLSDNEQNKSPTSPSQRNSSPNAFTKTEIEMAKTLCTLPSNGREERKDNGTDEKESNGKEEERKMTKSEEMEMEVTKFGDVMEDDVICRPISAHSSSGEKIFLNANFESFAEFDCAFEEWKSLYKHPFRVASSEKHHDPKFKYRYVVYHCSRYGEPRKRGQGRRPHQNYLPCGCSAKLRLNYHPQGDGCLCVTTLNTEHNHEPMSECHSIWLKRRKSSPEDDAAGAAERSGDGHDFESSTVSGEHSPNSTASSSTALFSPLSLHASQPHQLLHNSPSSSGGQSSSESAGSSASGGETAAVAALLMRTMPRSPLSEVSGEGKTQRNTTMGRAASTMFMDTAELGNPPPSFCASFKHPFLSTASSHPSQFVHGTSPSQQNHSLLLSTLKAALMANANGSKDGTQFGGIAMGNACKRLAGELLFRQQQQQQQRTAAVDQRQMDQHQMQQQWHILPLIQELLRLEQQQNSLINGTGSSGISQPQNISQNQQTLFALISQSIQRDQSTNRAASPPPPSSASSVSPLGTSATALLSALRSINVPASVPCSVGFSPASPSSPSPSSLLHPPTVSPLVGLLQHAHLVNTIGQPFGANGPTQQNGTTAFITAQQMQVGSEKQRREQQILDNAAMNMGRAEIIKEADLLLQTLVNQMIHSKDLVSYLARLRRFLTGSTP